MEQHELPDVSREARGLEELAPRIFLLAGILLAVGAVASVGLAFGTEHGFEHLMQSYLVSYAYFLSLALGGLFFVLLQHVTKAGWSVVVRRIAEAIAANVVLMALLVAPILFNLGHLYHWAHEGAADHDPILAGKVGFLNPSFFMIRLAVYFVVWILLAWFFYSSSTSQDSSGDPRLTRRMEVLSAPGMVIFALTLNFAAFDILMSVDPHWFSTIFGVYYFAGSVIVIFSTLTILIAYLQRQGRLRNVVTPEHYHDLGKFLFAFVVFWAYIAFSQYLLIWYGNIPEETVFYELRQQGSWLWISLLLLVGHFILPFLWLISRHPKRHRTVLPLAAVWLLIMHWLDLFYLVMPGFRPAEMPFHLLDLTCFVGLGGIFFATAIWRMGRVNLVAARDPRINESLGLDHV